MIELEDQKHNQDLKIKNEGINEVKGMNGLKDQKHNQGLRLS